ncbi:SRPBCC family protein [Leptospira kanakyensis]|uniref:Polyketide cyclase/dehydrase and lipid transport n=1 Tax=Leptospira kanakyensis TaxID=2484968 RepID=A0A6N4QFA5_9LEPT|nr:polyketide cyclase/dehydrase and lipid transport [Leptospira kanakyensis]MCW7468220.1 polyketide cyclase/dehydrase and lipid transport [Leptospira kanakyensis]MCW7482599.1 polyketide cyclase/dehydrase and lipid transport [Leptospira kanakyensis]TGK55304.1 polyketide cyclase/dehydrase and lipid transport [Leptospira kanakyensis]TGK60838.1 polyketide cyclase/dehydrase and lipid transport [Leptospira kanakyensis]TGK76687.1 polyketide cyclase/dehydrase and lipid transport [Leptospira kanakyensi
MFETVAQSVIHKPVKDVFAYVRNMQNQSIYNSSIISSEVMNGEATEYRVKIDLGILNLTETYVIQEIIENKLIVASCKSNAMTFTDSYEFSDSNGDCLLIVKDKMELKGLFKLSEGIVKMNLKTQMNQNLLSLKKILES